MVRKKAKGSTSEPLNNGSIVHIESVVRKNIKTHTWIPAKW